MYDFFPIIATFALIAHQALPNEAIKMCRFRDKPLFPRSHWNLKVGAECYFYCPKDWFVEKAVIQSQKLEIDGVAYEIPFTKILNKTLGFDYTNSESSQLIASTFTEEHLYQKWSSCAKNGDSCCNDLSKEDLEPTKEFPCPGVWDAWTCFKPARAGSLSEMPCPEYSNSAKRATCLLYSQKECFKNGTWNHQTDYSTCAAAPVNRRRHRFHVIVLYVSIALCLPAIVIFLSYRNLRIIRVVLHRNLLMACVVRNVLAAIQKQVVVIDALRPTGESNGIMADNGVPCRILAVVTNISANAIYACMLLDAFYLHKLIVRIFSPDPNVYLMYGVGIVLSVLPTAIWASLFAVYSDKYCWTVDYGWFQWIPDGFRISILAMNCLLLLDIFRGLLTKLRQNVNTQHTKSTLKAMSFLIPLFGVPFIFTANRNIVDRNSCVAVDIYYYISYSIQALQGFMVALLFCYWNKEAKNLVKGSWRKFKIKFRAKFGFEDDQRRRNTQQTRDTLVRTSGLPKNNVIEKGLKI